jgi:hypothetical protein
MAENPGDFQTFEGRSTEQIMQHAFNLAAVVRKQFMVTLESADMPEDIKDKILGGYAVSQSMILQFISAGVEFDVPHEQRLLMRMDARNLAETAFNLA